MTPRLFVEEKLFQGAELTLNKNHSHYLCKVLRLSTDNNLLIFNGIDGEWLYKITTANPKATVAVAFKLARPQISTRKLSLIFAPTKNVNSTYIVEKATELGVTDIYPIITQRTIVSKVNHEKLLYSAIEASEQCERLDVPTIHPLNSLKPLIANLRIEGKFIFCDETKDGYSFLKLPTTQSDDAIIIGPEGGFTDDERSFLKNHDKCVAIHLGVRVLRADTAAIAALAAYQAIFGDWNEK